MRGGARNNSAGTVTAEAAPPKSKKKGLWVWLDAILAVGYRVRSARGTQFRQWATARLKEYLVKGFVLEDERLKNPPGPGVPDYFDDLLERIRDIRASERRMYLRVRERCSSTTPKTRPGAANRFSSAIRQKHPCVWH